MGEVERVSDPPIAGALTAQQHYRDPENFHAIQVSGWEIFRLNLTPWFCRTLYQKALAILLRKAEYRLHKELNLGTMMHKLAECHNIVCSIAAGVESPPDLR